MGLTEQLVNRVLEIEPIRKARDERLTAAMSSYESRVQEMWEKNREIYEEKIGRAYEAGFYDGGNDDPAAGGLKAGRQGYKRISDSYVREGAIDYQAALKTAWNLWQKSPIAKRVLAIKRDHIIGHNAMPSCEHAKALEVTKAFWERNKLKKRSSEFTMQLFGMGEQCYPAFVRKADGRVTLGYIDPRNIIEVKKHPDNSLEDWAVVVGRGTPATKTVYRIIREDEEYVDENEAMESKYKGRLVTAEQATIEPWELDMLREVKGSKEGEETRYDGSCFFNKVNAVSNQDRGMSDLLQVADYIDQAEEVIFALADREQFAGYFSFDVTLDSADENHIKKRSAEIKLNPPRKGSVNVHNTSEVWEQWAPNLGQTGTVETFRGLLGLILGGVGYPVHWYGFGDDANLAVGVAQNEPTSKSLEHDQGTVKAMFLSMCQFAIDQAVISGKYSELADEDYELTLNLPEVTAKDSVKITASLSALTQVLITMQEKGWLTEETAVKVLAKVFSELDIDIDAAEELKMAAKEKEKRMLDEEQRRKNALTTMLNGRPGGNGVNGQGGMSADELIGNGQETSGGIR